MQTPKSMTLLSYGAAGPAVKLLQGYLNLLPPQLLELVEDGIFGSKTKARVLEFQSAAALTPDAIVGPMTWDAILAALGGPNQWLLRFRIIQVADVDAMAIDVFAKLSAGKDPSDPQGRQLRMGHTKLLKYFRISVPQPGNPNRRAVSEDAIKYFSRVGRVDNVGQLAPMPDWCGIFALWAVKAAGASAGTWVMRSGISSVRGFRQIKSPMPGDVGYVDKPFQHHFIVRWLWPEGGSVKVDTIEGNSPPSSNFSFKKRNMKQVDAWYSVF
jgi:hypothetical protein